MYRKEEEGWLKHWDFLLLDILCMQVAVTLAFLFRFDFRNPFLNHDYWRLSVLLFLSDLVTLLLFETFKNVLKRGNYREAAETLKHTVLVFLVATFCLFSLREGSRYSRIAFYLSGAFYVVLSYGVRVLWKQRIKSRSAKGGKRTLYLITASSTMEQTVKEIQESCYGIFCIVGLAVVDKDLRGQEIGGIQVDAYQNDIVENLLRGWVDEAFVSIPNGVECPEGLLESLTEMGLVVHISMQQLLGASKIPGRKQSVEKIGGSTVLTVGMNSITTGQALLKRLTDIAGGFVGCVFTGFLLLFLGPLIYLKSPGPIFFVQTRVGKNGKKFKMYKFRSMYLNAEARKEEMAEASGQTERIMFKLEEDPRIIGSKVLPDGTYKKGIGNFIRDWSLDEFPQFFNVLKGDMSLVGTRPPTVDEWEKYGTYHRGRLAMKPGITGLWQVSGRSRVTDFDEVVKLDREYIESWSMGLDFRILFKTVGAVFRRDGAM